MFNRWALSLMLVTVAGCTSVGEVVQLDRNTYSVNVETTNARASSGDLQALAAAKAREFCTQRQQDVTLVDAAETRRNFSNRRDAVFHFRCVAPLK